MCLICALIVFELYFNFVLNKYFILIYFKPCGVVRLGPETSTFKVERVTLCSHVTKDVKDKSVIQ